jgi:hypothetical protein
MRTARLQVARGGVDRSGKAAEIRHVATGIVPPTPFSCVKRAPLSGATVTAAIEVLVFMAFSCASTSGVAR